MPWRHGFRTRAVLRVPPVASVATAPRTWWKITVDRLVSQLRHQRHAAAIGDQLRYRRLRIAEVAEVPGAGRAGLHAGRLALALVQVLVVDPVHAKRAFLHHALDRRAFAPPVRAGPRAQLAADAIVLVPQPASVLGSLVAGPGGDHGPAQTERWPGGERG